MRAHGLQLEEVLSEVVVPLAEVTVHSARGGVLRVSVLGLICPPEEGVVPTGTNSCVDGECGICVGDT